MLYKLEWSKEIKKKKETYTWYITKNSVTLLFILSKFADNK